MSILTGAELGGGLPPPGTSTLIQRSTHSKEESSNRVSFSSDAAILQLTNAATRDVVQRGQELIDRRNEKNAAEKDQAREAALEEARNRSLEEQGLREPESNEDQVVANTGQGEAASASQSEVVTTAQQGEVATTVQQGEVASTAQSDVASAVQGAVVAEGKAPEAATVGAPLGTPPSVTTDTPADSEQKTDVVDESGRLDVVG